MKNAIVLTDGLLMTSDAKTAHGLIRGTERFNIIGLVDGEANAGKDAGVLLDPATVIDQAYIKNSKALSTGIEMVWVNGTLVYQAQQSTGKQPGVLIKRK